MPSSPLRKKSKHLLIFQLEIYELKVKKLSVDQEIQAFCVAGDHFLVGKETFKNPSVQLCFRSARKN